MAEDDAQDSDDRGFDPRYDPEFQRGYHATPGEQARTRMRAAPTAPPIPIGRAAAGTAVPSPPAPRTVPAPVGGSGAWEAEPAAVPDPGIPLDPALLEIDGAERTPPAAGGVPVATAGLGLLDRIDASPRTNRRILALWIIGVGFVVLGIVLYVVSVFTSYTNPTPNSDVSGLVFSQLGWMLAGPLVTVGLATLVTLVLLTALTARRSSVRAGAGEPAEGAGSGDDR